MATGFLIREFDIWRPGYDGAVVTVFIAGTTNLADLFTDEGLTNATINPQTLDAKTDVNNTSYGKFAVPIYTASPYTLSINIGEDTGIQRPPLTTLQDEDASLATVTVAGSSQANTLADIIGRVAAAENFGEIITGGSVGSAATNTTTIEAAIGALGGSGIVVLPQGVIRCNAFDIPQGVTIVGQGQKATTIQIISGAIGVTLTGDQAGFRDLTLDGNNLTAGSIGIYALNRTGVIFENFTLQNFNIGLQFKGGNNPQWSNFNVVNCNNGVQIHGDDDVGNTNTGGPFLGGRWDGGLVTECSTVGLEMKYVDQLIAHQGIDNVFFQSNTGIAVKIKGAQFEMFNNCRWDGNTTNFDISDDSTTLTPQTQYENKVIALQCRGGLINGGAVTVTGNAADIVFDHMKLLGVTFNMNATLMNNIILKDCFEDNNTAITGSASQLVRQYGDQVFEVDGITTGNAATRAWGVSLENNQMAYFEVKVIGVERNGTNRGIFHSVVGARRGAASLAYLSQTANFTLGDILTGATSGATARIISDNDAGASGTLLVGDIEGAFQNGEIITGSTTGSANANGTLTNGVHQFDYGTLAYGTQTANYTVGDTLTGATSGATGRILVDADGGSSGTLTLDSVVGSFTSGEIITGSSGGSATTTSAFTGSINNLRTPYQSDSAWGVSFQASAGEFAVYVQGNTSQTVDWTVHIELVTS